MRRVVFALPLLVAVAGPPASMQTQTARPVRVIAFGAHPDDAELKVSGVAALWSALGHKVKRVAMTNGDIGHFGMAGGPLAQRRYAEVEDCHRQLHIETEVLDIHDGELVPTLDNRKTERGRRRPVPRAPGGALREARGRRVKYAEAFQVNQYGRPADEQELKQLFPTFR